ncbi:MAG: response regulator [Desulfobacterales bacterium]|nr:MAG: response regulator [Desulfobacterales bacterium]
MQQILIIDDEEQIRAVFKEMLGRSGYMVSEASNGKEGLMLQREKPADLIITDIIMPEKEGLETIRELRIEFPEVKIIAISGGGEIGSDQYLNAAKQFGAACTLHKPIGLQELLQTVQRLLK